MLFHDMKVMLGDMKSMFTHDFYENFKLKKILRPIIQKYPMASAGLLLLLLSFIFSDINKNFSSLFFFLGISASGVGILELMNLFNKNK